MQKQILACGSYDTGSDSQTGNFVEVVLGGLGDILYVDIPPAFPLNHAAPLSILLLRLETPSHLIQPPKGPYRVIAVCFVHKVYILYKFRCLLQIFVPLYFTRFVDFYILNQQQADDQVQKFTWTLHSLEANIHHQDIHWSLSLVTASRDIFLRSTCLSAVGHRTTTTSNHGI